MRPIDSDLRADDRQQGATARVGLVVNLLMAIAIAVACVGLLFSSSIDPVLVGVGMVIAGVACVVVFRDRAARDTEAVRSSVLVIVGIALLALVATGVITIFSSRFAVAWEWTLAARPLMVAVLIGVAAIRFPWPMRGTRQDRILIALDCAAAAVAAVVLTTLVVVPAAVASDPQFGVLSSLRPWADAVIAVFVIFLACRSRMPGSLPFRQVLMLVLAAGIFVVSDTLALIAPGPIWGMTGQLWALTAQLAGVWLVVGAALRPSIEAELPAEIRARQWLALTVPLAPVLAALAVLVGLAAEQGADSGPVALVGAILIGALSASLLVLRHILANDASAYVTVPVDDGHAAESKTWLRTVVDAAPDIITVTDLHCRVVYQTPSVAKILGFEPGHWRDRLVYDFVHPDDHEVLAGATAAAARRAGKPRTVSVLMRCRDGSWRDTETTVTALPGDDGLPGYVIRTQDVSDRRRMKESLQRKVETDELTGLPNRSALLRHAEESIRGVAAANVAILALDLDGFRALNDTIGHAAGDEILRQVSSALSRCVRPWDVVARMGGDEFAVLIVGSNAERSVGRVHDRLQRSLAAVVIPDGREIRIAISAGYSVNDTGTETAEQLLRNADLALARVRSARRVEVLRFEAPMHDALVQRVRVEQELRAAIAESRLELAYQPIVRLDDGFPIGAEALVRWRHPTRGLIMPGDFVPLAEEMGIIHELGAWAMRQACRDLAELRRNVTGLEQFTVSVNVSGHQLEIGLVSEVASAAESAGVSPSDLVIEVTESVLAHQPEIATEVLSGLRALGCRVAFDDFGTGYSALSYLAQFPVDMLKIDRSFIMEVAGNSQRLALTRTIVSLGHALQLAVVAEGVETAEQASLLRGMGCEHAQGYVYSRPVPLQALLTVLRSRLPLGPFAPTRLEVVSPEVVVLTDRSSLPAARTGGRQVSSVLPPEGLSTEP